MRPITPLLLLTVSTAAHPFDVEVGAGISRLNSQNGIWYQEEFENDIPEWSPSFRLGARFDLRKNIKLHLGYSMIAYSDSTAKASASDQNYWDWQAGKNEIWPLSTWDTSGYTHGLYALASYWLPHSWYVKGGIWAYKSHVDVNIPDWRCDSRAPNCQEEYPGAPYSAPQKKKHSGSVEVRPGWVLGLGKAIGQWELEYSVWQVDTGHSDYPPVHTGPIHNFSVNYAF